MDERLAHLIRRAAQHGFDVLGVSSGEPVAEDLQRLERWVAQGHGGELGYMTRNPPERADPRTLQKTVRTVVSVAVNHYGRAPAFEHEGRYGRVARYAWGRDYHDVVLPRLRSLARELGEAFGGRARAACDHSPILERAFAARAGLGFFGKNTCLIRPRSGSWFFLGELILEAELPEMGTATTDHCGTCTACLDLCPTDAFPAAFELDARRCISYLTIEHRGAIPLELRERIGAWLFGCDICQEVCPFNRFAEPASWPEFAADAGVGPRIDLEELLSIPSDEAFASRYAGTPLARPGRVGLQRNAAVVAANIGATHLVDRLDDLAGAHAQGLLGEHARWALTRLEQGR